ncbi:MAG: hypothetical protein ACPG77_13170 [Nannocystaceae bacterium]
MQRHVCPEGQVDTEVRVVLVEWGRELGRGRLVADELVDGVADSFELGLADVGRRQVALNDGTTPARVGVEDLAVATALSGILWITPSRLK